MRRFTEVLLLVVCTLLLLPPSLAQDLEALQPTVKHSAAHRKDGVIRGLLDTRQNYYYCPSNYYICESTHCCPRGWNCCSDGGCCSPNYYCGIASNGIIGCCENGRICSGPAGPPSTINPGPAPTPTTNHVTSTSTSKSTFTSQSTTTFTTLVGGPTQTVGYQIIEVTVLDVNITWSQNWVQGTSSCSASTTSKSTSTENTSFTYLFQYPSSRNNGFYYYFNVVNKNAMWEVFINGLSDHKFHYYSTDDCTYYQSYVLATHSSPLPPTQNLTVVVYGLDSLASSTSGPWSLEVNKLLIRAQNPSPTSTTLGGLGTFTQTPNTPTSPLASAAGGAQPYRPLLVFGGILLAVLCCA